MPDFKVQYHRDCVSTYTSKSHLKRLQKSNTLTDALQPQKRVRRSTQCVFDFKKHCLFCGESCEPDNKHPNRRRIVLCRSDNKNLQKSLKASILDTCAFRSDDWAGEVLIRVQGAVSDLQAAEGRYHYDCKTKFMAPKSVQIAISSSSKKPAATKDEAYEQLIQTINEDKLKIRSSSEVFDMYQSYGGTDMSRKILVSSLSSHFKEELLTFTSKGLAYILVFREKVKVMCEQATTEDNEEADIEEAIKKVAKQIKRDILNMPCHADVYHRRMDTEIAKVYTSKTMMNLLCKISESKEPTLPMIMICNMITNLISRTSTPFQIALGILIRKKYLIQNLFKCGVICSYSEVLRFRKSAAKASKQVIERGLVHTSVEGAGLVQVVVDNFDTNISSQNGLQSTHSLAMILTQTSTIEKDQELSNTIHRIKKEEMNTDLVACVPVQRYNGPKKPVMPQREVRTLVTPLKILASQVVSINRANRRDFRFMSDIIGDEIIPEWNGFNCSLNRESGCIAKPATTCVYTPLINMKPADPDTMLTAMVEAEKLVKSLGQNIVVLTCDQQLYKIAVDITWAYPDRFKNFVLRLGGMHFLTNFIGCIGTLMEGSGLSDIMECAFGSVGQMLKGKKFPQNFRALRLIVEELLLSIINEYDCKDDLMSALDNLAKQSRTTKLWVDMLIKPVFLMMLYCRAEKEGDWPLHVFAVGEMMPYFFAARHPNYSRYGLYYLRSIASMPKEVLEKFLKGEHVTRHISGLWNGMWTDMMIETTFMKYAKGPHGIIGFTLRPETLNTWALSLHMTCMLEDDLSNITSGEQCNLDKHKEEMKGRMISDANDRSKIRLKLKQSVDPLAPSTHNKDSLIHIVSGRLITEDTVNVDNALSIGKQAMKDYESKWPESFYDTLPKLVNTMALAKKHVSIGSAKVHDTNLIYSRIIGLQASGRDMDLSDILKYELSPVPTSLFHDTGNMRIATNKSTLKQKISVELNDRLASKFPYTVIDGTAVLWLIHWPENGTAKDFIDNFTSYVLIKMDDSDVYLVFDRYRDYSIKSATRMARGDDTCRKHQLTLSTKLPSQKIILNGVHNKGQLIDLIIENLQLQKEIFKDFQHKLVVTGRDTIPLEIDREGVRFREEMKNNQEEADVIMLHQMLCILKENSMNANIRVISDDTDVFVLLLHFYKQLHLTCQIVMEATSRGKKCIDIKASVKENEYIVDQLLSGHAISGCDTVSQMWGIGMIKMLKVLQKGYKLDKLGNIEATDTEVYEEAMKFLGACYGCTKATAEKNLRYDMWKMKTGNPNIVSAPSLKSLPPTNMAFKLHVMRAHFQACIWKHAINAEPPSMDPVYHGWVKDTSNKTLVPQMLPKGTPAAPDYILKLIRCSCQSCKSLRCSCSSSKLPCTVFCNCEGGVDCFNDQNRTIMQDSSEEEDD